MSWYAIESVDDAIDATRSFLFPVEAGAWLRLALIAIFVGVGGGGGVTTVTNLGGLPSEVPAEATEEGVAEQLPATLPVELWVIGIVIALTVLVGLALTILAETLRFVFYDALRTQTVRLREPARRRVGQAVRLFGFKLLVGIAFLLPFVVVGAALWAVGLDSLGDTWLFAGLVVGAGSVVAAYILYALVIRGTDEFVVPLMVEGDCGVLDGWRRFWPVVRSQPAQFAVYIVVHFLLLLAIGIGQSIVGAIVFGIVGTIGALVGLVVVLGVFGSLGAAVGSTAGLVALGGIVLLTLLVTAILYLPVSIVVLTYVITYEVSVLELAADKFELLAADAEAGDPGEPTDEPASPT